MSPILGVHLKFDEPVIIHDNTAQIGYIAEDETGEPALLQMPLDEQRAGGNPAIVSCCNVVPARKSRVQDPGERARDGDHDRAHRHC